MPTLRLDLIVKDSGTAVLKQFGKQSDSVFGKASKYAKGFGIAAAAAAAAVGTAAVVMGREVIKAASDFEETQAKFSVVFKDQMQMAEGFAQNLSQNYNMSREESRRFLSSIQDLLVPMGMASNQAAAMSNEVVKLSADLGSFNNLPTETVMLDIQSALVGNFETMKKYGVVINATTVQQKALEMGLANSKAELTANHKAMAAYELIVAGSAAAIGDVARNTDTWAYQTRRLQATISDTKVEIGQALLPVATAALKEINNMVLDNQDAIVKLATDGFVKLINSMLIAVDTIGLMRKAWNALKLVVSVILTGIVHGIAKAVKAMETVVGWGIKIAKVFGKDIKNPVSSVVKEIEMMADAASITTKEIVEEGKKIEESQNQIRGAVEGVVNSINRAAETSAVASKQMVSDAKKVSDEIKIMNIEASEGFKKMMKGKTKAFVIQAEEQARANEKALAEQTKEHGKAMQEQAQQVEWFNTQASNYLSGFMKSFRDGWDGIKNYFKGILDDMLNYFADWASKLVISQLFGGAAPAGLLAGIFGGGGTALAAGGAGGGLGLGAGLAGFLGLGGGGTAVGTTVALGVPSAGGLGAIGGGVGTGGAAAGASLLPLIGALGPLALGIGFGMMRNSPSTGFGITPATFSLAGDEFLKSGYGGEQLFGTAASRYAGVGGAGAGGLSASYLDSLVDPIFDYYAGRASGLGLTDFSFQTSGGGTPGISSYAANQGPADLERWLNDLSVLISTKISEASGQSSAPIVFKFEGDMAGKTIEEIIYAAIQNGNEMNVGGSPVVLGDTSAVGVTA